MPRRESAPNGAPCWIDLLTSDPDTSRAFYGELFGWTSEVGGPEYGGYITFAKDGLPIAGAMAKGADMQVPDLWSIYLASEDIDTTVKAVEDNGGSVHVPPMAVGELGHLAFVEDASGGHVGVWQPGQHKGFGLIAEPGAPAWFELFTRDHAKAVRFYEQVFGWETSVVGDSDEFRYTTLGKDEDALAGVMDASSFLPEGVPPHWSVYFAVADADATLARIGELSGSTVVPAEDTPYGRLATAADPTGAMFKLLG